MIGSRKRPIFSIDRHQPLDVRVGRIALVRRRLDAGDRQRDDQQRLAAERIVVLPEDGAAFVLDLRRELVERAGGDLFGFRRRQPDGPRRDLLPPDDLLLRHPGY